MRYLFPFLFLACFFSLHAQNGPMVITKTELMGKFEPSDHLGFVELKSPYATRNGTFLREKVAEAFIRMADAARKDGVRLEVVSGTRNFDYQVEIWNRKYEGIQGSKEKKVQEILLYSSMPGTSRHHWGTDIDINSVEPTYFETNEGKRVYDWLSRNASRFGFYQPYTPNGEDRPEGYREEKWHWSYLPQASIFLKAFNEVMNYEDLKGFDGAEIAPVIRIFESYVNGIHPSLLHRFPL